MYLILLLSVSIININTIYSYKKCLWEGGCLQDDDCVEGTYCYKQEYWSQCREIHIYKHKESCINTYNTDEGKWGCFLNSSLETKCCNPFALCYDNRLCVLSCADSSIMPSQNPSIMPSQNPSIMPSIQNLSIMPSQNPSIMPSQNPSIMPSQNPSIMPSQNPSIMPSQNPSIMPSQNPSIMPSIQNLSIMPSQNPSIQKPSIQNPSIMPSHNPSIMSPNDNIKFPETDPTRSPVITLPQSHSTIRIRNIRIGGVVAIFTLFFIVIFVTYSLIYYLYKICFKIIENKKPLKKMDEKRKPKKLNDIEKKLSSSSTDSNISDEMNKNIIYKRVSTDEYEN